MIGSFMFSFDPYSPAVDADPFPLYRITAGRISVLLEQGSPACGYFRATPTS